MVLASLPEHNLKSADLMSTLSPVNLQVHHVTVRGGPGGYEAFIGDIRRIFGITAEHDMQLAFDCADPVTGALPHLGRQL